MQPGISFGCTLGLQPVRDFDRNEYIFIGEVIGLAGPFASHKFKPQAWGLKIKVDDPIYLPKTPASYFEIVPFESWSDCTTKGIEREDLIHDFPIGSKVKVIARAAKLLPGKLDDGNIRLEITSGSLGSISRNDDAGRSMTSSQSVFDYKAYRGITVSDWDSNNPLHYAHSVLPEFELRKDLLRLRNAGDEAQRTMILERLVYYPDCCDLDFHRILKKYTKNRKVRDSLIERREKWDNREVAATN
jgi:hypothetical protein